jgi:hypothetical protein
MMDAANGAKPRAPSPEPPSQPDEPTATDSIADVEKALRDMAGAKGGHTGAECESLADILAECLTELRATSRPPLTAPSEPSEEALLAILADFRLGKIDFSQTVREIKQASIYAPTSRIGQVGNVLRAVRSEEPDALREAFDAMVIVTPQGQPCYRTSNGIPQGMPKAIERKVRRALAARPRGEETQ